MVIKLKDKDIYIRVNSTNGQFVDAARIRFTPENDSCESIPEPVSMLTVINEMEK